MNDQRPETIELPIADVRIGKRFRQDFGDLASLAKSMGKLGLLQAIVVTPERKLVAGERRLLAAKDLGWTTISARVVDLDNLLEGEHDENELHKPFSVSERVAIAQALRDQAGNRKGVRTDLGTGVPRLQGRTDDHVAKAAGFESRAALHKAEEVIEHGADELVRAMDDKEVSITDAASVATLPREQQIEALAKKKAGQARTLREGVHIITEELGREGLYAEARARVHAGHASTLDESLAQILQPTEQLFADGRHQRWYRVARRTEKPPKGLTYHRAAIAWEGMSPLSPLDRALLKRAIAQHGSFYSVLIWNGQLIDCPDVYELACELDTEVEVIEVIGPEFSAIEYAERAYKHKRCLSDKEISEVNAAIARDFPEMWAGIKAEREEVRLELAGAAA